MFLSIWRNMTAENGRYSFVKQLLHTTDFHVKTCHSIAEMTLLSHTLVSMSYLLFLIYLNSCLFMKQSSSFF